MYLCGICSRNVRSDYIYRENCNFWVHRRCANLSVIQLDNLSNDNLDWYCQNCVNNMFPFSGLSDEELIHCISNNENANDNTTNIYDRHENYIPFVYDDRNDNLPIIGGIDPDNNLYNRININSVLHRR